MAESITKMNEEANLYNISIKALRPKTKDLISALLNPPKVILTDSGLPRDWHGLADLIGIGGEYIPHLQCASNPTTKLLQLWQEKDDTNSTIKIFLSHLENLERFDVIDDSIALIDEDLKLFEQNSKAVKPITSALDADFNILTRDDLKRTEDGLDLQFYDAFVLYADEDTCFATELIDKLENQYKLKLCAKDRDLIFGVFEHDSIVKLISERCARLIAIISPAFLESSSNKFFCCFAQSLGIEQRTRKIIPCLYTPCKVPPELSCYFMLDYQRLGKLSNFWERLRDAIKTCKITPMIEQSIYRSTSQQIAPTLEDASAKLTTDYENDNLKPKKEGVKFNSMINLNYLESERIMIEPNANHITDEHITNNTEKRTKPKSGWLKKLLPHKNKCNPNIIAEGSGNHKKSFWLRNSKRKLTVAN